MAWQASGDPTRNVNITNWSTQPEPKTIVVCQNLTLITSGRVFANVSLEGYRYVSIFVWYYVYDYGDVLYCCPSCLGIAGYLPDAYGNIYGRQLNLVPSSTSLTTTNLIVGAPNLCFITDSFPAHSVQLTIVLYCYN